MGQVYTRVYILKFTHSLNMRMKLRILSFTTLNKSGHHAALDMFSVVALFHKDWLTAQYFRQYGQCQKQFAPHTFHVCYQCDHTHLAWIMVSRLWPLESETLTLKKKKGEKKPQLASVLKSQFHSGSSIALTRSGWQQEFVSPPNLEITFSAAGQGPPSFPFPFSLSPCNPASLALYWEVTSQDPLTA